MYQIRTHEKSKLVLKIETSQKAVAHLSQEGEAEAEVIEKTSAIQIEE